MKNGDFKGMEIYNNIRVDVPFIVRLDGWAFHTFTKNMKYIKPFDEKLSVRFIETIVDFFKVFNPSLAYYFSDEISFVFFEPTVFDRIEKLNSLMPSYFASKFSTSDSPASFDCRIIPAINEDDIIKYMVWRQAECKRNFLNGWAEKVMADSEELSPAQVAKSLMGLNGTQLKDLCKSKGVDIEYAPLWQQAGVILYSEYYLKEGYNPITNESVMAERRYTKVDYNVPSFTTKIGDCYLHSLFSKIKSMKTKTINP